MESEAVVTRVARSEPRRLGRSEALAPAANSGPAGPARTRAPMGLTGPAPDMRHGMAEAGVSVENIAKVLNHVGRGARATRVYDRYSYDPEKRVALDAWVRRLDGILQQKRANTTVVPFQIKT